VSTDHLGSERQVSAVACIQVRRWGIIEPARPAVPCDRPMVAVKRRVFFDLSGL
jgi:hypothetical protein